MYMQNYLKKPQLLRVFITVIQLMKLSEKMKFITGKHHRLNINNTMDDVKLCVILLGIVLQQLKTTYWMSTSELVIFNLRSFWISSSRSKLVRVL